MTCNNISSKIDPKKLWTQLGKSKKEKRQEIKIQLIEYYFPFAQKIAYKLAEKLNWKVQPEELSSFGVDGLYGAIESFDPLLGYKFETFASQRIRGAMFDGLRREDWVPRSVRINKSRIENAKTSLESELGHSVTDLDIIKHLNMDAEGFIVNRKKFLPIGLSSIENSHDLDEDDESKKDCNISLIDNNTDNFDRRIFRGEFFGRLMGDGFSEVEKRIVYYYYYKNLTMEEISLRVKLSESRVSQMHKVILVKLKKKIDGDGDTFSEMMSVLSVR